MPIGGWSFCALFVTRHSYGLLIVVHASLSHSVFLLLTGVLGQGVKSQAEKFRKIDPKIEDKEQQQYVAVACGEWGCCAEKCERECGFSGPS